MNDIVEVIDKPDHGYTFFVTDKAQEEAVKLRDKYTQPPLFLRIRVMGDGCHGYAYKVEWQHEKRDDDISFDYKSGLKVIIDPKSVKFVSGTTLEWEENIIAWGFKFNNPNVKSLCGCGTSFEV